MSKMIISACRSLYFVLQEVTSKIFAAVSEAAPGGILPEQVFLEISQKF